MAHKKSVGRRGNNEGSVCQRNNGSWMGAVIVGTDKDGKVVRKYVYGKTRPEVLVKMTELTNLRLKNGNILADEDVQTLMREWLFTFKQFEVTARTFEKNLMYAKSYVYPQIGAMMVNDVTTENIQKLLNAMRIKGYALDTIKHTKHLLRQFFEYCKDSGLVSANPVDKVKLQARERKTAMTEEYKAIPIEARQAFLDALGKNKTMKPLCMTMMFAGLRVGEALALRWRDVNFDKGTINVDNALTQIAKFDSDGNVISRITTISDTKTAASIREVPIPNILIEALKQWHTLRWRMKNLSEHNGKPISFIQPNDFVFSTDEGTLRSYYGTRAMFDRFIKENDLVKYKIHFHTLRHTYSTMLFESGENPKAIQGLMGHKDVMTTLRNYNSVDQSQFRAATDKLDGLYKKSKNAEME